MPIDIFWCWLEVKMYILIKEDVPVGKAVVVAAHASLKTYKEFEREPEMQEWINGVFHKVVCKVNEKEFEKARAEPRHVVLTESTLNDAEVALAFCPREEYPKHFKFFKLFK